MGNVQLGYETMQRTQLIEAIAAIHKYDITVANDGQIGSEKLRLTQNSPMEICSCRAAGLSAFVVGECWATSAAQLMPASESGGTAENFTIPSIFLEGGERIVSTKTEIARPLPLDRNKRRGRPSFRLS